MRSRRLPRCSVCGLHTPMCLCAGLPRLTTRSRLTVIAHRTELFKSTNTGRLAVRVLADARLVSSAEPAELAHAPGTWVLFPGDDALPLREAAARGVHTLLVPDGTWTQARRIARRHAACRLVPRVRLEAVPASAYRLRRNAREDGLCTYEAVAEAMRVLEGDAVADAMLAVFARWLECAERIRLGAHVQGGDALRDRAADGTQGADVSR